MKTNKKKRSWLKANKEGIPKAYFHHSEVLDFGSSGNGIKKGIIKAIKIPETTPIWLKAPKEPEREGGLVSEIYKGHSVT